MSSPRKIVPLILVAVAAGIVPLAHARPFAVDEHAAICQPEDPTSVSYDISGITATKPNTTVVCPLGAIAMTNDSNPLVKIQIKMLTGMVGSMSCTFDSLGSQHAWLTFTPTPGGYSTIVISPADQPVFPHDNTAPVRISLLCTMTQGSTIDAIQMESTALPSLSMMAIGVPPGP